MKLSQIPFGSLEPVAAPNFGTAGTNTVGYITTALVLYVFPVAGILLLLYLLAGGFQVMLSRGNPENIQRGKARITNALVGFAVIFVAFWIVIIIARILDLQPIIDIFG